MNSKNIRSYDLIIAGGGAAGFFGAINAAMQNASLSILILEKTSKLLSKVKVSGGGRCNVTHHCFEPTPLSQHYPRGQKELKKLFREFQASDTVAWFKAEGIILKTEDDGRMFPVTDDSQTIIDCFLELAKRHRIEIEINNGVESATIDNGSFLINTSGGQQLRSKKMLVAIGGHPQSHAYNWLRQLGHRVTPVIPSLFTFNDSEKKFKDLMGVAVPNAGVKIAGSKFSGLGPVLITHWGLSGPAVIKLSAWAATYLHELQYIFTVLISWIGEVGEDALRSMLNEQRSLHGKRKIISNPLYGLPQRLWERLIILSEISESRIWSEASNKEINKLIEYLIRCPFNIRGKTTFKEEFVSCGGIDLEEINLASLESKLIPGLFFAGEVLNIDGETGGFNFQSAWTTAAVAAKKIGQE